MLGHKRHKEDEKSDDNSLSNKNTGNDKKNFNANFLMKLYQILETPELTSIIEWGENGKFFKVKNITEFTEKVLPKFFKHNNFASFVRQVNFFFLIQQCLSLNFFFLFNFFYSKRRLFIILSLKVKRKFIL